MEYTITKKKIKNFIIKIYPDRRIKVSVPLNASKKQIELFLENKKEWINSTLEKFSQEEKVITENLIKFLGKPREKRIIKSEINMIRLTEKSIYIYHNFENINNNKINEMIKKWKNEQLNLILEKFASKYLNLLNIKLSSYKIKNMSSAWGIYHLKGNYITFNSLLIEKDIRCIEYVVLHELCHIVYQNHKKEFWDLVEQFMPNYKEYRYMLKQNSQ